MDRLLNWLLPPNLNEEDRPLARLTANILLYAFLSVFAVGIATWLNRDTQSTLTLFSAGAAILLTAAIAKSGRLVLARYLIAGIGWLAVSSLVAQVGDGTKDVQILGYPAVILIATLLLGKRGAVIFTLLSFLGYFGLLVEQRYQIFNEYELADRITLIDGAIGGIVFILIARIQLVLFNNFERNLKQIQEKEAALQQAVAELQTARTNLENIVAERTVQLRVSTAVGRVATETLDPNLIVANVANLISNRFGYYYAAIFLLDENNIWAELRAATGTAGATLLERQHRLQVGGQSMVGNAIATRRAQIALDVGNAPIRFNNPLLPDTRSEIALPLLAGGRVLGALDVQSVEEAAFSEESVEILQNMANQIAVAIENARLYQESQNRLAEMNRLLRREFGNAIRTISLKEQALQKGGNASIPDFDKAVMEKAAVTSSGEEGSRVTLPLMVGGQVIGVLALNARDRQWREDEITLLTTIGNQAASALENARLIQDSRQRAERERILSESTTRIRQTLDIETILQTAVDEIRASLNLEHVEIQIVPSEEGAAQSGGNGTKAAREKDK
jgi:GAF domain-containing protein